MNTYLRNIILTTAGCHLILLTAGEIGSENARKNLRFLCGIVVLLTLFSPLRGFIDELHSILDSVAEEIQTEGEIPSESSRTAAVTESAYAYVAEQWILHLTENYPIRREQISIRIHATEQNQIESVEIILKNCPYVIRRKAETEFAALMDFPVSVKGE